MPNSNKEAKNAKFFISKTDWNKVIAYAESAYHQFKSEIGGQLVVVENEDGDFILKCPVILKQTVSSGNCEMEEEALAVHYSKMVGQYGDKIRHCWWHSHHTMGAFWSGTDDATILEDRTHDFSVSLVVNLKQEYKLRVQFFYPFEHEENVTLNFLEEESERNSGIDSLVKELCQPSINTVNHYNQASIHGNQSSLWTEQDQKVVDYYNMGYNYSLTNEKKSKVSLDSIPEDKVKPVNDLIEDFQDKLLEDNCTYEQYLEMKRTVNKSIKRYNLKMKHMNKAELERVVYHYWPEDFLENINKKEGEVAN